MKQLSPELLKIADHCQNRSFITNKYTGARIAVDCGHCNYCIRKRARLASMRVKTAGSAFKYCYFVTLTYDNAHLPLFKCEVLHSEYDSVLSSSGDTVYSSEFHAYTPVSEYQCLDSSSLRHIYFTQVQGTVPFDRTSKEYTPIKDNWFCSMDSIRAFISKTQGSSKNPYSVAEEYGADNLIPFLNYVDVQNYIKRLRRHLSKYTNEKISFYAVGEYGPVHFRPHFHLLLFFNSEEITKVLRLCHDKSWSLGRSDLQCSNGGCASYVASYINSFTSAPLLYRSCRAFRPKSRASLGFFEKGETYVEDEDPYAQIEKKIDSCVNGRLFQFGDRFIKSTPPLSYLRALLPKFSSSRHDDVTSIVRVILAVASAPSRIARVGLVDYNLNSILAVTKSYYQYVSLSNILTDEDKIILHAARCLDRFCLPSSDVDIDSYIGKLYRLFLLVSKFLRLWHLPSIGSSFSGYYSRIRFIISTGISYELRKDYDNLTKSLAIQSEFPEISHCVFALPSSGCESDALENVSRETFELLNELSRASAIHCSSMIKHKKLNDANGLLNDMI